jgi:hypothetical protein
VRLAEILGAGAKRLAGLHRAQLEFLLAARILRVQQVIQRLEREQAILTKGDEAATKYGRTAEHPTRLLFILSRLHWTPERQEERS